MTKVTPVGAAGGADAGGGGGRGGGKAAGAKEEEAGAVEARGGADAGGGGGRGGGKAAAGGAGGADAGGGGGRGGGKAAAGGAGEGEGEEGEAGREGGEGRQEQGAPGRGGGAAARRSGEAKGQGRAERQGAPGRGGGGQARLDIMKSRHGKPTGEASRQRTILAVLASHHGPSDRTRTAIAKAVAGDGARWKNMYSGVFNDIGKSLVPQGLIEEEGRLPYGRGPRAVQEAGIPYYRLTRLGRIACLALDEVPGKAALLDGLAADLGGGAEKKMLRAAAVIARFSPEFVTLLFGEQAESYSEGSADSLLPAGPGGGGGGKGGESGGGGKGLAAVMARFVSGIESLPKKERDWVMEFLRGAA